MLVSATDVTELHDLKENKLPFSFLALAPKPIRVFVATWILLATAIRAPLGIAETKGWLILPEFAVEAIIVLSFFIAIFVAMRTKKDDQDGY